MNEKLRLALANSFAPKPPPPDPYAKRKEEALPVIERAKAAVAAQDEDLLRKAQEDFRALNKGAPLLYHAFYPWWDENVVRAGLAVNGALIDIARRRQDVEQGVSVEERQRRDELRDRELAQIEAAHWEEEFGD